jgi:imidazolonepropionase-like amidohydrolase
MIAARNRRKPRTMGQILFKNAKLLDPNKDALEGGVSVLVEGDTIREVSSKPIKAPKAQVIDCGGRTLMPGLIDCHVHVFLSEVNIRYLEAMPLTTMTAKGAAQARAMLDRGFTTVRDTGGPVFGLKLAIDRGVLACPRIFPSGAMLSQTSGQAISACSTPCRAWRAIRPTIPGAPGLQRSPMARPKCCAAPTGS